jgi:hypothetical protein
MIVEGMKVYLFIFTAPSCVSYGIHGIKFEKEGLCATLA